MSDRGRGVPTVAVETFFVEEPPGSRIDEGHVGEVELVGTETGRG